MIILRGYFEIAVIDRSPLVMSCYGSSHIERPISREEIERIRDSKLNRILQHVIKQSKEITELKRQGETSAASIGILTSQVQTLERQIEEYKTAEESSGTKDKNLARRRLSVSDLRMANSMLAIYIASYVDVWNKQVFSFNAYNL